MTTDLNPFLFIALLSTIMVIAVLACQIYNQSQTIKTLEDLKNYYEQSYIKVKKDYVPKDVYIWDDNIK